MKVCIAEAMKLIKDLEEEKDMLVYGENRRCTVSYKEGKKKFYRITTMLRPVSVSRSLTER